MFTKAIVRPPGANYGEGLTRFDIGAPDYPRALNQHELYCAALERCGLTLTRLEMDERFPDSTFVEDTAVLIQARTERGNAPKLNPALPDGWATAACAILTRPGAASRAGEIESIAKELSGFYSELRSIQEPGTVDGGDVCEADNQFFIGISERTNETGARQLEKLLASYGYSSSLVDIRSEKDILHLKSGLAYLGDNRLAVIESLAKREEFDGYELVRLNGGEEYAANCVRVNNRILVAAGYSHFEKTLRRLGYETIALDMSEFRKMDGGLSCLSLRF